MPRSGRGVRDSEGVLGVEVLGIEVIIVSRDPTE